MTKQKGLKNRIALVLAAVMLIMALAPVTALASWNEKEPNYNDLLSQGTVDEARLEYLQEAQLRNGTGLSNMVRTLRAQLDFLENFGGQNADDTTLMLDSYDMLIPLAERTIAQDEGRYLSAPLEVSWIKLRMDRYRGTISSQQYTEAFSALIAQEIKRHDEADSFLSETSEPVLYSYCRMMREKEDDEALQAIWERVYTGDGPGIGNSKSLRNWFVSNKFTELPWFSLEESTPTVWMVTDGALNFYSACRVAKDGTVFYPVADLLEASMYEQISADPDMLTMSTADGSSVFEIKVGSNLVQHNSVEYELEHPVKNGFYVSEDFFEACFPQTITIAPVPITTTPSSRTINGHIMRYPTYPGTEEQLTFALGLAAPINIYNLGALGTPSGSPYFEREDLEAVESTLVPVSCVPRYHMYYPTEMLNNRSAPVVSIRKKVLPNSWGVYDRFTLLSAINGLSAGGGHNDIYRSVVEMAQNPDDPALLAKYGGLTSEEIAEIVSMYRWHLERWQLPESGIAAWDISRAVQLAQWGTLCGYIDAKESVKLQIRLSIMAQQSYDSWEEFGQAYLAGYELYLGRPETAPKNAQIEPTMGDRSYIISEIYKNNSYRGVPWNLDLTPLPPPELETKPDVEPNAQPPAESTTTDQMPSPTTQDNPVVAVTVTVICVIVAVIAVIVVVVRRKKSV